MLAKSMSFEWNKAARRSRTLEMQTLYEAVLNKKSNYKNGFHQTK